MKEYRKDVAKMRRNRPKLYALILQHMSDESLNSIQKEENWEKVEQGTDLETLWSLVEHKHKIHLMGEVEAVVKLAARMQLATIRQGAYESIIAFKQCYTNALKAYKDQKNPEMTLQDEAMNFFSKLDNARYAEFKTTYLNNLQLKTCNPPKDLNEMFTLANTYLKLLREVEKVEREICVSGIRSTQLVVDQKGYLQDFFHVYASEKA
jgi:hypothetical protein